RLLRATGHVEELRPGRERDDGAALTRNVLNGNVFVELVRVGAHLKQQYRPLVVHLAVAHCDAVGVNALAAAGEGRVHLAKRAVLNQDVFDRAVFGQLLGSGAFAALHAHAIVVYGDVGRRLAGLLHRVAVRPKAFPEIQPVAIDGTGTGYLEIIDLVGIDERRVIIQLLAFHARRHQRVVRNIIGAFELGARQQLQLRVGLEKQR
nr:hypothetical protein [Tanacetum cinerariifolium]